MANYEGYARSNYFKVKDEKAFKVWVDTLPVECHEKRRVPSLDGDSDMTFMVTMPTGDSWPSHREDNDGEDQEIDFAFELSQHLADDWVCQLTEIGHEKMLYLHGYTEAFNNKGGSKFILLDFTTSELNELGKHHTRNWC